MRKDHINVLIVILKRILNTTHLKIKHNEGDRKTIQCGTYDFKCLYRNELMEHIRIEHTKDPLLCFICDANYLDRKSLRDHVKKHGRKLA